jgi:hypothetical protein
MWIVNMSYVNANLSLSWYDCILTSVRAPGRAIGIRWSRASRIADLVGTHVQSLSSHARSIRIFFSKLIEACRRATSFRLPPSSDAVVLVLRLVAKSGDCGRRRRILLAGDDFSHQVRFAHFDCSSAPSRTFSLLLISLLGFSGGVPSFAVVLVSGW